MSTMAARTAVAPLLTGLLRQRASRQVLHLSRCLQPSLNVYAPLQSVRFLSDQTTTTTNNTSNNGSDTKEQAAAAAAAGKEPHNEEETATQEFTDAATPESGASKEQELEAQIKELKDQLLRSLAEQDNTRRIAQKDIDSARQFAIKNFAKSLLDVSDNLTRALDAVPTEALADKEANPVLGSLYEGIQLTEAGLNKAFTINGLVKFGEIGDKFDPNQHEALMQYPDPSKDNGVVGQVMKKGFLLNKRVLRPAEVGVIKNS